MSHRRLVLSTLLAAFQGPVAPPWALDLVAEGLAGHVLFGFNVVEAPQLAALTASLRAARPDVLIGIDEEGGDVTRLAHLEGSPYPGNAALGAIDDTALTEKIYRMMGDDLADAGVNLNLAPSVDVNTASDNPIIGTRSFGASPQAVAAHAAAAVRGLQSAGVAACAKHFPGHGATTADSHLELPTLDADMHVLRERDLPPFVAAIGAGTKAIMTAHIRVPTLTGADPATFSRAALVSLLREDLGFTGAIVTDALEMQGSQRAAGGTVPAAARALTAGADLLCIGADVTHELVEAIVADMLAALTDGRLALERLKEASGRAAALAAWTQSAAVARTLDRAVDSEFGLAAARRAVTIEGTLPPLGDALVVQLESASNIAEGPVPWGMYPHVTRAGAAAPIRAAAEATSVAELRTSAAGRPIVLVGRNLHRLRGAAALIETLATTERVVAVEMGWPSSWRPAGAVAFVTTYGASRANGRAVAEALGLAA